MKTKDIDDLIEELRSLATQSSLRSDLLYSSLYRNETEEARRLRMAIAESEEQTYKYCILRLRQIRYKNPNP